MFLSENIRFLRKQKGLSQDEIAEKMGYKSYTTIQKWEMGVAEPPISKLSQLAEILNVDMDDLAKKNLCSGERAKAPKGVQIPVFGKVAAGIPIKAIEDILDYEEITPELAATGDFFALQINGNSMEPRMEAGDVVIVRQQDDCNTGDIAVVIVNGDLATVKKIKKRPEGVMLISYNAAFDPKFYTNQEIEELPVRILGKVIELRAKFN